MKAKILTQIVKHLILEHQKAKTKEDKTRADIEAHTFFENYNSGTHYNILSSVYDRFKGGND